MIFNLFYNLFHTLNEKLFMLEQATQELEKQAWEKNHQNNIKFLNKLGINTSNMSKEEIDEYAHSMLESIKNSFKK